MRCGTSCLLWLEDTAVPCSSQGSSELAQCSHSAAMLPRAVFVPRKLLACSPAFPQPLVPHCCSVKTLNGSLEKISTFPLDIGEMWAPPGPGLPSAPAQ